MYWNLRISPLPLESAGEQVGESVKVSYSYSGGARFVCQPGQTTQAEVLMVW
jgi:hypothetical protein